jgi:hypothetical protein
MHHYSELFKAFERSTIGEFRMVLGESSAQVHTSSIRTYNVNPLPSAQGRPGSLLTVQVFRVQHFTAPSGLGDGTCLASLGALFRNNGLGKPIFRDSESTKSL